MANFSQTLAAKAQRSMPAPRVLELDAGKSEKKVWLVKVRSTTDGRQNIWETHLLSRRL